MPVKPPAIYFLSIVAGLLLQFIRREEAFLQAEFGQAYLDYKAKVRRWL